LEERKLSGPIEAQIVVAGHLCLDVIPAFREQAGGLAAILAPGKLAEIGPALLSTGGAVSNTGLALHRLGVPVKLMGKLGEDLFGRAIIDLLKRHDPALAEGMIVVPGEHSSYTIVISPPNVDRLFLHCTGANDTFSASDVSLEELKGAKLFHFGYPPLMRNMYANGGAELVTLFSTVKAEGLTVSLDMAWPDPDSPAGKAAWRSILAKALPHVDLFLPSLEEILFMLHPDRYAKLVEDSGGEVLAMVDGEMLSELAGELLEMGAAIVVLKLGEHGLYVKTSADAARLSRMGACAPGANVGSPELAESWLGREMLAPCFSARTVSANGAGDCTIAGFLAGLLKGLTLADTLLHAAAVGACNVEQADATSGVPAWTEVERRIAAGWEQREVRLPLAGWQTDSATGIRFRGPAPKGMNRI
jgi:sugar/nucleoside kinase (ribokinase family)